jgi:glycine/D-amino acid oxidase-like deaminating enzyme
MVNQSEGGPWRPLWRATVPRLRAPLNGHHDVEFAIVGGGLEGLALALQLAREKKSVMVVEAADIGSGATGASAGIVAPQLVRQLPADVIQRLGQPRAERFLRLLAGAGHRTFDIIGSRKTLVEASAGGFIAPAKGAAGAQRLAETVRQWHSFRSDLRLLSEQETRALTGTSGYAAALLDPSGGWLNPVAYAQLLASDAEAEGAVVYLHSPVAGLTRNGAGWQLTTDGGTIQACQVILCANGGNTKLSRPLRHSVLPLTVCQVATQPLPADLRASILPQGHSMTDVETEVFSIRFDPDGRLITAYPFSERLLEPGRLSEIINRRLTGTIANFHPVGIDYAWSGTAWLASDLLPRVVALEEGLFAIQACNGRGIALSTSIGAALGNWLAMGRGGECAVPIQPPRAVPGYFLARYLPGLLMKTSLARQRMRRMFATGRGD